VQLRTEKGRKFFDGLKIKIPVAGTIFRQLAIARFCRVLGTLLKNGVPILRALDISRDATGNKVITEAIEAASENITSGEPLSVPLSKSGHFPRNVTEMMSVAEESNTLDTVLVSIADSLEKRTLRKLEIMVKMVEPLMLLVMALVIMFVVVALLHPVMKMGEIV
ncbi:MAG: type II secretion system F family protein, partial [Planctomycetota bacterium]